MTKAPSAQQSHFECTVICDEDEREREENLLVLLEYNGNDAKN